MNIPQGYQLEGAAGGPTSAPSVPNGYVLDPAGYEPTAGDSTTTLGAAGRGAVGMLPLGTQAYAGIAGAIENKPYLQERQELEREIEADKANHPGARLAGQAAGVIAPALLTGGASLPGEALTEGALMGAGFGAGNAVDTLASGGSGTQAAMQAILGTAAGAAGGAAGKALGNVITKVAKPFMPSQEEATAAAVAHILGGTTRQIRSLPGKNPTETLVKLGQDMTKVHINGEPLIAITDQMPARLNKFITLQKQAGETIGDTIKNAGVPPMATQPIAEELDAALKFATPDDQAQMKAVIDQVWRYADKDGTIPFEKLQLLKGELGDRAFHGEGNSVLQSAYHVVSDAQDRELEKAASTINKPEFDAAKNAYQLTSRAIPMLRMAVSKEIGGKMPLVVPGAALLSGHPIVAAGALMKNRLGQMASGATFKALSALPENAGALSAAIPGQVGGQISGAAIHQNMGETKPVHAAAMSPAGGTATTPNPTDIQSLLNHPALEKYRPDFATRATAAKNPGESQRAMAQTDFIKSQSDPAYAAAKQKAIDEPNSAQEPLKMADGGVVDPFVVNRDAIEPGIMGETEPPEMKVLKALSDIGTGYGMGELGAGVLKKGYGMAKDLGEAGAIFPHPMHFGTIPVETANSAKDIMPAVRTGTGKIKIGGPRDMHSDIMADITGKDSNGMTEGFYDNLTGKFLNRDTAAGYVGGKGPLMAEELIKLKQGGLKLFDPAKPPTGENLTAMKLTNGEIVYSPAAKIHADLINQGLDPEAVVDGGFITAEGKYISGSADTPRIMRVAQAKKRLGMAEGGITLEETQAEKEKRHAFGSNLEGLANLMKNPVHETKPQPETLPTRTTQRFHQPFNTDLADKLKAFLANKEKDDAESR